MKKKMFAILVSLAMTVCMLPTAVFADEAAHQNHCVCGGALEGHAHNTNVTWIGVSSLDEITKSGNYYLKNNVEYNGTYKPADGVVLCLNGKNITCTAANLSTVTVGAGRTFTITDCQTVPGKITHASGKNGRGITNEAGTVNLWRGSVCGNTLVGGGAGVFNGEKAYFNMYGGSIADNTTTDYGQGAGVYNRGSFTMPGGVIEDNYATGSGGGGIYNYKGTVTMSGTAVICNNVINPDNNSASGGGIGNSAGTFIMNGGEIYGNSSDSGAGVGNSAYDGDNAVFTMHSGVIHNNESGSVGGGMSSYSSGSGKVEITLSGDAVIRNNKAKNGGGISSSYGGVTVTMSENAAIKDNSVSGTRYDQNSGGGVYFIASSANYPTFNMNGGTVSGNSAKRGGGFCVGYGALNIRGGSVTGNTASYGGGVYVTHAETVTLSGKANITGNYDGTGADKKNSNLYLNVSDLKIMAAGLTDGAKVGITPPIGASLPMTVTGDTVTKNYFVSDDAAYETAIDLDGHVILRTVTAKYTVKINLPTDGSASHVTTTGALEQTVATDSYRAVRVQADDSHYFSNDNRHDLEAKLEGTGIYVATVNESESLVITGSPTKNVEVTLVTTAKRKHAAPRVWGQAPYTADGNGYINIKEWHYSLEYRRKGTEEWKNFGALLYRAVEPGYTYEVRYKGSVTDMASPISECYVPTYTIPKVADPTPNNYVYDGQPHDGVALGQDYAVSSGTNTATDAGTYVVYITPADGKQWTDGTTTAKAVTWRIDAADQDAPAGLTGVKPTTVGANDGKITGVTAAMEYRKTGTVQWIACADGEITGLAAGSYEVRYKAVKNYNAGKAFTVTVPSGDKPIFVLTVLGGSGSGSYEQDTTVTVKANAPAEGKVFDKWVIRSGDATIADANSTTTTVTVKNAASTVEATYKDDDPTHMHSYETKWSYDAKNHWHACACGDKADLAAHTFVWKTDKAATATETGLRHEECSVCGAKRNENTVIAKLSDGSTENGNSTSPKTGDTCNMFLWIALLFISGGVVVGATLAPKKKKISE